MLDKVLGMFHYGGETLRIRAVKEADEKFQEERSEEIREAEKKVREFYSRIEQVLEELDELLEGLEGYGDPKDRAVVEDVVENVVENRRKLIDGFTPEEDIEELESQLEGFFEEYRDISRKEGAVLEEANLDQKLGNSLKELQELHEELQDFLENDYKTVERYREVENSLEELESLEQGLSRIEEEKEELDSEAVQRVEEKEEELEELENSELEEEYRSLEEQIDDRRADIEELEKGIGKAMGKMERGLKKLIYEGEIGKTSREGSEILREIRDGEKDKIMDRDPGQVEDAVKAVEDSLEDQLDDKTEEKLRAGIETFKDFSDTIRKIESKRNELEELEEEAANHEFADRKEELEEEIRELEEEREEVQNRKEDINSELEGKRSEIQSKKNRIKEILREEFERVEIGEED